MRIVSLWLACTVHSYTFRRREQHRLLLQLLILIVALALLTAGAESLVRGAAALARRMGVSAFVIGLTVVGFGTSTPELFTGIAAAIRARADPAYANVNVGNIVGSNIFNIAFILGLVALIMPIHVGQRGIRREIILVITTSLVPFAILATGGTCTRWHGALLVALLMFYVWRAYVAGRADGAAKTNEETPSREGLPINLAWIAGGLLLLVAGSEILVRSAVQLARGLGVSELVISLTIVAAGTSAPELFTSLMAALRRQPDLSVGNILGSNIFNILGILGAASLITPQTIASQVFWLDAPVMVLASAALLPIAMRSAMISRIEGACLFSGYIIYVGVLIALALR